MSLPRALRLLMRLRNHNAWMDGTASAERISTCHVAASILKSSKGSLVYIVDGGPQGELRSVEAARMLAGSVCKDMPFCR